MVDPTRDELKAAAGWTLVKRQSTTPEHVVALDEFRDGCEALLPFARAAGDVAVAREAPASVPQPRSEPIVVVKTVVRDAQSLPEMLGVASCESGGAHKFNIHDRRCVFCNRTYLDVMKRKPELMT